MLLDRLLLALLSIGTAFTLTAGAALAGLGFVVRTLDLGEATPAISSGLISIGAALFGGGAVSLISRHWRSNASLHVSAKGVPLLAAMMLGIPVLLLIQLMPLAGFWQDVLGLADRLDVWQGASSGAAGLILVPAGLVLMVPGIQAAAAIGLLMSCVLLLPLLLTRSGQLLRALVVVCALAGGWILAGSIGVSATERLAPTAERLIRETPDAGANEQAQARALVERYQSVTRGSTLPLALAWLALFICVPALAVGAEPATASPPLPDKTRLSSRDDGERARAYQDAARHIDRAS